MARADYCWIHLKSIEGLVVKRSNIPQAGQGLFAARNLPRGHRIRYGRPEDRITPQQLHERYGDGLAAYAIRDGNRVVDAASTMSGWARYIDDPRGTHFHQNSALYLLPSHSHWSAQAKLTRPVAAGHEIYTRYGAAYWAHA